MYTCGSGLKAESTRSRNGAVSDLAGLVPFLEESFSVILPGQLQEH